MKTAGELYEYLSKRFAGLERTLEPEERTELDWLLWSVAQEVVFDRLLATAATVQSDKESTCVGQNQRI